MNLNKSKFNGKNFAKGADLCLVRGFTLIETLIYVGIVSGFVVMALLLSIQIIDFSDRLKYQRELGENQRFIIQKLDWILSGVQTINSPSLGSTGSTLSVDKINFSQNPLVVDLSGTAVRLSIGGGAAIDLTNGYASTSNLVFEHLNFSGKSAIRITVDLENYVATTSINTTIIIN